MNVHASSIFETPVNPTLQLIDIAAVRRVVDEVNQGRAEPIRLIVDKPLHTVLSATLDHGADIVVHSLTKDIGGFGTDMGGVVIAPQELHSQFLLIPQRFLAACCRRKVHGRFLSMVCRRSLRA